MIFVMFKNVALPAHGFGSDFLGEDFCNRKWIFIGWNYAVVMFDLFFAVSKFK